jgi:hypothetical protein
LRVVFNDAITDRQIVDNPASGVAPPPREKVESKFLTKEQTRILVDAARDNRYYVAVKLLAETGLRRGEALAISREGRPSGGQKPNATVIEEVDEQGFYTKFMTLLETTFNRR